MHFISLRSGSYGNGYLISDGKTTLMLDAGVPRKLVYWAMNGFGLPAPSYIFISHEHHDHIKCLGVLLRSFNAKVVATPGTLQNIEPLEKEVIPMDSWNELSIDGFGVRFIPKPHDAADPVCFMVEHKSGDSAAIVSDLGYPETAVVCAVAGAKTILIESNYDDAMLRKGRYSEMLKQRIAGRYGHLSNRQCGDFLQSFLHNGLQTVILGHLSENNNMPEIAFDYARKRLPTSVELAVASRFEPLAVFRE